MPVQLTKEFFAERKGHAFQLEVVGQTIELELVEVESLGAPSAGVGWGVARPQAQREAFSLIFRGPQNAPLDQGMFKLSQAGMDDLEPIFLVPVAADEQGRYYEAIFN